MIIDIFNFIAFKMYIESLLKALNIVLITLYPNI